MIIDSHAYCFEPLDSPRGYASGEEHLRWAQAAKRLTPPARNADTRRRDRAVRRARPRGHP